MSNSQALMSAVNLLRKWGVTVEVDSNATTNGRPYDFTPIGIMRHHTASHRNSSPDGNRRFILSGKTGVPGPLAQIFIDRGGVVHLLSFGRANHAGAGGPWRGVPEDSGNQYFIGVEVDNNGIDEPYPAAQLKSARLVDAAVLIALKRDHTWLLGHKEWAPSRKIDPKLDMDVERGIVHDLIEEKLAPPPKPKPTASLYTVRAGDTLWRLAQDFHTTVEAIVALNRLPDASQLRIGAVLNMPAPRTYKVQAGDTLYRIAVANKTTVADLVRLNGLADADHLAVGQTIRLP